MRPTTKKAPPLPPEDVLYACLHPSTKIYDIKLTTSSYQSEKSAFKGACLDIGAQKSVIGFSQAQAYSSVSGTKIKYCRSPVAFKFGDGCFPSIGKISIRIPTPGQSFIHMYLDIVQPDVPMLLGLDVLDKEKLIVDNVENAVYSKKFKWSIPVTRKEGHLFLTWKFASILFTKPELRKLHLHFFHPSQDKLFNLIKRAHPRHATPQTRSFLAEISKACGTCQHFSPKPQSFKVSFPGGITFNSKVAIDLMKLNNKPVLHVVDIQTHFSAAAFLPDESLESVWLTFLKCWASVYTGFPDVIKADQGSVFTTPRFGQIASSAGINIDLSGIESHNSLGAGEKYHDPLRKIYLKIRLSHPSIRPDVCLSLAVKAMNDTMNSNGLVPSLLVFGVLPRFPTTNSKIPAQQERMNALQLARREMETIVSKQRIHKAISSNVPFSATYEFKPGEEVLVYREKEKVKWTGPYHITRIENKQVFIDRDGTEVQHSISQIRPYIRELPVPTGSTESMLYSMFSTYFSTPTYVTETLPLNDPRSSLKQFSDAKRRELNGLMKRETWKVVPKSSVAPDANVLSSRFVLSIKDRNLPTEEYKARLVAQGHRDKDKAYLVHDSTNLRQSSIRTISSLSSIKDFQVWSHDVSQAYLQSSELLLRKVYLIPPPELNLPDDQLLLLIKPLYGLPDSGDYWSRTMVHHQEEDLGMKSTCADPALYFKHKDKGILIGISGIHVDDSLHSGNKEFLKLTDKSLNKFESRKRKLDNMKFSGINISTTRSGMELHQWHYISQIKALPTDSTYSDFLSSRAKMSWLVHTRPDIVCSVAFLAQVTNDTFSSDTIKAHNKVVTHLLKTKNLKLTFPKLTEPELHIKAFADSSFANNGLHSQLGYIIMLCDKKKGHILSYSSKKSRRVVRSVMGGEVYAFADAFDAAYATQKDLELMLNRRIPLQMFTDSKSLFDVITKCSITAEKRLMIDITSVRNAFNAHEISNVGLVRSENNPADAFTKVTKCPALEMILEANHCNFPVEQWVYRLSSSKDFREKKFGVC